MLTFAEHFDFAGKTVYPFTTHAMSGPALAIRGEEAETSRPQVEAWARTITAKRM